MATRLIYSRDLNDTAAMIGLIWKIPPTEQKSFQSLEDFGNVIGKNAKLDELVIFAHGFSGGIMIDDSGYSLRDQAIMDTIKPLNATIKTVRFEGCHVGENPLDLYCFGNFVHAEEVSGFTWAHWSNKFTIPLIQKGSTVETLKKNELLKNAEKWIAPGAPTFSQLASMARHADVKNKVIPMEWFQYTLDEKPPYAKENGSTRTNLERLGSIKYKARSEAANRSINASALKTPPTTVNPSPAFEYVTINMKK